MTVSIIIAVKTWQKNLEECVVKCLELDYSDFEIIILPDYAISKEELPDSAANIRVIPTGPLKPADKRDIGLKHAKGEIVAFIDDDAYPVKSWLKYAIEDFSDPQVAAVGGPGATPPSDGLRQQASGKIYSSVMVSGDFIYRYIPRKMREVDDLPSCNLIVRRSVIESIGGFDTHYWPGEDTKLCLDIVRKLSKKIIYDPRVLVYHHRRSVFKGHLKQIASYALHRGYFVKKYPETSFKISYFIPSIFVIGLITGLFIPILRPLYVFSVSLYLILAFLTSFIESPVKIGFLVFPGLILTHLTYGVYFLKGLAARRLKY